MFQKYLILFCLTILSHLSFSQITISYPVSRQIFQRDLNDQATITISGSYSQPVDKVEARFVAVVAGQGTDTEWSVLKDNPIGGLFRGTVVVKGGWYKLEVRGSLDGKVVGNITTLDRVGVGEVFIIAGQSNAGGIYHSDNDEGATDDRVNCADFSNVEPDYNPRNKSFFIGTDSTVFSIITFSQLSKNSSIGPRGLSPYYWAKFGDILTKRLNRPVMFFNVAFQGTSAKNWSESADGIVTESEYVKGQFYRNGTPYSNLKSIANYYSANMGTRAILWMQGEEDNFRKTTADDYKKRLENVIKKSRADFGKDLAWVVARTSWAGTQGSNGRCVDQKASPAIINAQNQVITSLTNIFPGPFTDDIETPRIGGDFLDLFKCVHFSALSWKEIAERWNTALDDRFFRAADPVLPDTIPTLSLECVSATELSLELPAGYSKYDWGNPSSRGSLGSQRRLFVNNAAQGITLIARVTNPQGRIIQVPTFTVKANNPPVTPTIRVTGDANFCDGTSIRLSSSDAALYQWTTGARTKDIDINRAGNYSVTIIDKNGCQSKPSPFVITTIKPRPPQPTIGNGSSTVFCDYENVSLTSSTINAVSYLWTTGEITRTIVTNRPGNYSVRTVGANGCLSPSSVNITTLSNVRPTTPTIRAEGDTVVCQGKTVTLRLTSPDANVTASWLTTGREKINTIVIPSTNGTSQVFQAVTVDNATGCISRNSNPIFVTVRNNPETPSLNQIGAYTLEAKLTNTPNEYNWKYNGTVITQKSGILKVNNEGAYSVIAKVIYPKIPAGCLSAAVNYDYKFPADGGLSVYPNPSKGLIKLEARENLTNADVTIYTMGGELVFTGNVALFNGINQIDLESLAAGKYILNVKTPTFESTKTIVLVR